MRWMLASLRPKRLKKPLLPRKLLPLKNLLLLKKPLPPRKPLLLKNLLLPKKPLR